MPYISYLTATLLKRKRNCEVKFTCFIQVIITCCLLLLLTQACSSISQSNNSKAELKTLGKDIVDMGKVPKPLLEQDSIEGERKSAELLLTEENKYLTQQRIAMASVPKYIISQYQQALQAMRKKQWQEANALLDQVIQSQPQLSGSYVNKAIIARQFETSIQARQWLDKAIEINPLNPYAYNLLAQLAQEKGLFEDAEKNYQFALTIWPAYPEVHANFAVLLELYRGRLDEAKQHYLTYLELRPNEVMVQRWLAGVNLKISAIQREQQ